MSFLERQKYFRLFGVSHKGLFVHGQSVQCQEKSLAQGGVTLSEIKFWPPFTSNTLRLKKILKNESFFFSRNQGELSDTPSSSPKTCPCHP